MESLCESQETGTSITFWPDPTIFTTCECDYDYLAGRLRELTFLHSGLQIILVDYRHMTEVGDMFLSSRGVAEFLEHRKCDGQPVHPAIIMSAEEMDSRNRRVRFEVAFQWMRSAEENCRSYVNTLHTQGGGSHLIGFFKGLKEAIHNYGPAEEHFPQKLPLLEDIREGLTAVLSLRVPEPHYSGPTKDNFHGPEAETFIRRVVSQQFSGYLETHPDMAKAILARIHKAESDRLKAIRSQG